MLIPIPRMENKLSWMALFDSPPVSIELRAGVGGCDVGSNGNKVNLSQLSLQKDLMFSP